jgi:hypothetical protein
MYRKEMIEVEIQYMGFGWGLLDEQNKESAELVFNQGKCNRSSKQLLSTFSEPTQARVLT